MNYKLHHIGKVVKSIETEYQLYNHLGFKIAVGFIKKQIDNAQKVIVGVVNLNGIYLELLEPLTNNSPIVNFLHKGGGFHHVCYEVHDINQAIKDVKKNTHSKQLTPVTNSVWKNKPVVFFLDKSGTIFELLQA